jgi:hypothetical protein
MSRLYSNENVPIDVVTELRRLGHDVLTSYEAGNANTRIADPQVLSFGSSSGRVVLTNNRRDFIRLHRSGAAHAGVIVFTFNPDSVGIAIRVHSALGDDRATGRFLARIDGVSFSFD